jgi:hypothetical protein
MATRARPQGDTDAPGAGHVWRLGVALVRRHWIALGAGAIVMGGGSQLLELLPVENGADNIIAIVLSTYLYFIFLVFVEMVVQHDRGGARLGPRDCAVLAAAALAAALPVALVGTAILTAAALLTALFVLPGVWFLTRTGLTVPAMVMEGAGPLASVRRSLSLTSRRFWLALLTVGLALVIDEVVDAEVAIVTHSPLRGGSWLTWTVGGLVSAAAVCFTAPVVSVTFQRLEPLGPRRRGG